MAFNFRKYRINHSFAYAGCCLLMLLSCGASGKVPAKKNEKQYLALGDSYTIGEGVAASETYPQQLTDALSRQGAAYADPQIIARTGWTTGDLLRAIRKADPKKGHYDLVSLLIGVNNQFQGRSLEEYKREFGQLLDLAEQFAARDGKLLVLSIPDYGYTPFGKSGQGSISVEIDRFNEAAEQICASRGITFIDITAISRKGLSDPSLVAGDGLHPSGKMYASFAEKLIQQF